MPKYKHFFAKTIDFIWQILYNAKTKVRISRCGWPSTYARKHSWEMGVVLMREAKLLEIIKLLIRGFIAMTIIAFALIRALVVIICK